ncbi:hypothetical protein [Collimonas fungivorans]|uniref:hypothetical protein n=1 Tax=Collimonas fungivorans TaxID=158899 RepID=UPI003FA384D6
MRRSPVFMIDYSVFNVAGGFKTACCGKADVVSDRYQADHLHAAFAADGSASKLSERSFFFHLFINPRIALQHQ